MAGQAMADRAGRWPAGPPLIKRAAHAYDGRTCSAGWRDRPCENVGGPAGGMHVQYTRRDSKALPPPGDPPQLVTELRHSAARLEALHELDQAILAAESPRAIAEAVVQRIRQLLPACSRASVTLFDVPQQTATILALSVDGVSAVPSGTWRLADFPAGGGILPGSDSVGAGLGGSRGSFAATPDAVVRGTPRLMHVPLRLGTEVHRLAERGVAEPRGLYGRRTGSGPRGGSPFGRGDPARPDARTPGRPGAASRTPGGGTGRAQPAGRRDQRDAPDAASSRRGHRAGGRDPASRRGRPLPAAGRHARVASQPRSAAGFPGRGRRGPGLRRMSLRAGRQ